MGTEVPGAAMPFLWDLMQSRSEAKTMVISICGLGNRT